VLVLEREARFRDRVRGEGVHVWGTVDVRELGIYDLLVECCAHELPYIKRHSDEVLAVERDLAQSTPSGNKEITFFHPDMQETLIRAASDAGAVVWRAATVTGVRPGDPPAVSVRHDGAVVELSARLVVGADGRRSKVRNWAGFQTQRDEDNLLITGAIVSGLPADDQSLHVFSRPGSSWNTQFLPLGNSTYRCYFVTGDRARHPHIGGRAGLSSLVKYARESRVPESWLEAMRVEGPLATFEAASWWVESPYRDGVALIGDAAAAPDPCFGNGLSLALRDTRLLRDALLSDPDWHRAASLYAARHDATFSAIHTLERWAAQAFFSIGSDTEPIREHANSAADRGDAPDIIGRGPDQPVDDEARRRFLGY
jgi:2-polyprenyl-6-methoxyphenol hydroxylase-like FAD-dependent oxidoreductase